MKKFIVSSVIATTVLFPALVNADELKVPSNIKTVQKIEIRKGDTSKYPIIATLSAGKTVRVTKKVKNASGETWYLIDTGKVKGWVFERLFTKTIPQIKIGKEAIVNTMNINVRKGPSTSYSVILVAHKNQPVKIIGLSSNSHGELWYKVTIGKKQGWIYSRLLTEKITPAPVVVYKTVLSEKVDVKSGTSSSKSTIGTVKKNDKVKIISTFSTSKGEKWYKVATGKIVGWVFQTAFEKQSVLPAAKPPVTTSPDISPKKGSTVYVLSNGLNLFQVAADTKPAISILSFNQAVKASELYATVKGEKWIKIEVSPTLSGWVPLKSIGLTPALNQKLYVTSFAANLRKGPSMNESVLETVPKNTQLISITSVQTKDGDIWFQAYSPSNKIIYVNSSIVSNKPPINIPVKSEKKLISPAISIINGDTYLIWKKTSTDPITYTKLSGNHLKLSGGFSDIELPKVSVKGANSVESVSLPTGEKSVLLTFDPGYTFTIRNTSSSLSIKIIPKGLTGKKIIIDAGHGGKDTGAIGPTGLLEKNANLGTALLVKKELEKHGAIVTLTRSTDIFLELSERTSIANRSDYDAFISLHSDSLNTVSKGTTTYYNSTINFNGPNSKELANTIQKNMIASLTTLDRGVKEQEFYVNRKNELPSILIELAYISNPTEEALLRSDAFRLKAANGVRMGLEEYFSKF